MQSFHSSNGKTRGIQHSEPASIPLPPRTPTVTDTHHPQRHAQQLYNPSMIHNEDAYTGVPTWPPPYPIDTSTPAFNAHQPGLAQRDYFAAMDQPPESPKRSQAPIKRQRISRACDRCNQLRTKCDGKDPCAHCTEFQQQCTYDRIKKKRGKAPRQQQQQRQSRSQEPPQPIHPREDGSTTPPGGSSNAVESDRLSLSHTDIHAPQNISHEDDNEFEYPDAKRVRCSSDVEAVQMPPPSSTVPQPALNNSGDISDPFSHTHTPYHFPVDAVASSHLNAQPTWPLPQPGDELRWSPSYSSPSVINDHSAMFNFSLEDLQVAYAHPAVNSIQPPSFVEASPMSSDQPPSYKRQEQHEAPLHTQPPKPSKSAEGSDQEKVKYPILEPLVPHLQGVIPIWLACRLLEEYFSCAPYDSYHPRSPYIFNYFHRKSTFLSERPSTRKRSRSLLASMLWLAARTCDIPYFTSDTTTRPRTCKQLLEMTIQLLVINPFLHHSGPATSVSVVDQMHLAQGRSVEDKLEEMKCTTSQTIGLDEIITEVHIATVVSASESKKESIRWWNAAWNLARELQLGRELGSSVTDEEHMSGSTSTMQTSKSACASDGHSVDSEENSFEEEREERRRAWWLLYLMDRHLSLCYNKPLFLLQRECLTLLHPLDDDSFQRGQYVSRPDRLTGQPVHFTGTSVFQFFLPLMAMLGDIQELHDLRTRPLWGNTPQENSKLCERRVKIVQKQLDDFQISATAFQNQKLAVKKEKFTNDEHELQVAVAYGLYISNVLHVLIWGKWDPIELLAGEDWLNSDEGRLASEHAVKAAEYIAVVLELDPDLSFMPYFLGIQLLQGSFILLVLADKHQTEATPQLIKACEIMVRAHEACVVTLDTEYQRNFRKIMRSALAEVRGRVTEETKREQQKRRREVLSLYRWTDDGRGIAL